MGFSCLVTCGLCLSRIGDREIRSLSTASEKMPCSKPSRLRTLLGAAPLSRFIFKNSRLLAIGVSGLIGLGAAP